MTAYAPPSGDRDYWERASEPLVSIMKLHDGEMSLREIKSSMRAKKVGIKITVNILSYLSLAGRVGYSRDKKVWYLKEDLK